MSRMTQPYRKGAVRPPGQALTNMLRGRTAGGMNTADIWRGAAKLARAGKHSRGRAPRPQRPARPPRP
jgi:hypothetical protein